MKSTYVLGQVLVLSSSITLTCFDGILLTSRKFSLCLYFDDILLRDAIVTVNIITNTLPVYREDNVNRAHFPEDTNPAFYVQTPARHIFLTNSENVSYEQRI